VNRINPMNLELVRVSTDLEQPVGFALDAVVNRTGTVRAKGTVIPATLGTEGMLKISRLGLTPVTAYLPPTMHLDVAQGSLDLSGSWDVAGKEKKTGTILGDVRIADGLVRESGNKKGGWF
jgi:hypothetical protein